MSKDLTRKSFLGRAGAALAALPLMALGKDSNPVPDPLKIVQKRGAKKRNMVFILTDDHRYDAMGAAGHPFVDTPNMDYLANNGMLVPKAYVTTSLCSPSRASILTGQYAHTHRVVDNQRDVPDGTIYFPQYLQKTGYETAFVGKWHMGSGADSPRQGFDHWVSFRGQGSYWPDENGLNVNGKKVKQKGYITDEMTDYALDWFDSRDKDKPFMLYLSHKAVHNHHGIVSRDENNVPIVMTATILPPDRYKDTYKDKPFIAPKSLKDDKNYRKNKPMWVVNQRNSWHGMDFPWHNDMSMEDYYRRYMETVRAVDDSVGKVIDKLREQGLLDSTLVVYMGDNGFLFGEHGLIDKRNAYEPSMRVPMLVHCPELIPSGTKLDQVIANIDIAPTFMDAAGLEKPEAMEGESFLPLLEGKKIKWRDYLLYEYYWERNFPHTPTIHALRGEKYKYIHYYGLWDTDELYDIQSDPDEMVNLINDPKHLDVLKEMNKRMFDLLEETGGMDIPLKRDSGYQRNLRRIAGSKQGLFHKRTMRKRSGEV